MERRVVRVLFSSELAYTMEFRPRFWRFRGATFRVRPDGLSFLSVFASGTLSGLLEKLCLVFILFVSLTFSGDLDFLPLLLSVLT